MKIRIGFGLGTRSATNRGDRFASFVDDLERLGFDSLWLSERINGDTLDPLVGMAYAAARTTKLKFGMSVMVLPGRNPVVLAKELASLDLLSGGRLLPAFGLGVADVHEQNAFGVRREDRAKMFDEALPLLRRLWSEDDVDHEGTSYRLHRVTVRPKPQQQPLDVWMGGIAPSELRRVGRLGDGWLPSFCTVDDVREGIAVISAEAGKHGRAIEAEHFGALIAYRDGPLPDLVARFIANRRPGIDPEKVIPDGLEGVRTTIEEMLEAGASKFVVLPFAEPDDWTAELERVAAELLPLQN
ncbi:MAG: TIGR03619 family F420-dependent LLM class oxidoreductase [Actinobacteria bacterium]|nr:TIGR03619 family F420-dependent LLM class oxidoreductase [Actinomycetota bacterium]